MSDRDNHNIQIFDADGKLLANWGGEGSLECQFNKPAGVAVDENDYIYVVDSFNHRVQVFGG